MQLARGEGALAGGALVVHGTAQDDNAVISAPANVAARDYARVTWQVRGLPPGMSAALLWNTDIEPDRLNRLPLTADAGVLLPANVADDPHWLGRIRGIALVLHGDLDGPVAVLGAEMGSGAALDTLRARLREWAAYGAWNGTSINTVPGGADIQLLPLPLLLFAASIIATAALGALASRHARIAAGGDSTHRKPDADVEHTAAGTDSPRSAPIAVSDPIAASEPVASSMRIASIAPSAVLVFLASWFVLDARWQVTLARHVHDDSLRFAGKTWAEKHLALDDGALFAFAEKTRAMLPPIAAESIAAPRTPASAPTIPGDPRSTLPTRVFVVADSNYLRGRAAYHLYPWNVWSDPTRDEMPPADRLHRGDWIVVYQRRGVEYDAATHHLRWEGGKVLTADLKLLDHGGALFELN